MVKMYDIRSFRQTYSKTGGPHSSQEYSNSVVTPEPIDSTVPLLIRHSALVDHITYVFPLQKAFYSMNAILVELREHQDFALALSYCVKKLVKRFSLRAYISLGGEIADLL